MFFNTPFNRKRNKTGFHLVKDNWNDYGFYTLFNLYYLDENDKETNIGNLKIGHKGQEVGHTTLPQSFNELPEEYFSLGLDVQYYSKLRNLGDEVRLDCLIGLRDIAYFENIHNELIQVEEKVFETSLLRDVNRNIVRTQFRRIAHGGAVLTKYNFSYELPNAGKDASFNFKVVPKSLPPTNIHTIIGTNGSGKTTTLKGIVDGYLEDTLEEKFSNAIFISFSIFDKNGHYQSNSFGNEYYYVGVKKLESQTKSQEELKSEFQNSIKNILSKKRYYYLHTMIEMLNADYNLSSIGVLQILNEFLETSKDNESVKKYSNKFAGIFNILSSGHQIILLSISKIVELIVEKTLIIIDEPETHLHPPLLSAFVRALSEITVAENAVAILATHSPVILQEVPKSCVSIIRKHGTQIKVFPPRFETFGENIGVLTEEVFGLEIPKTGFHSLLRDVVEETPDYDEVLERFNNELSVEAKSVIRTHLNEIKKK
ncbi:MAG: AAA family ATPase [Bacillota bacterium]